MNFSDAVTKGQNLTANLEQFDLAEAMPHMRIWDRTGGISVAEKRENTALPNWSSLQHFLKTFFYMFNLSKIKGSTI